METARNLYLHLNSNLMLTADGIICLHPADLVMAPYVVDMLTVNLTHVPFLPIRPGRHPIQPTPPKPPKPHRQYSNSLEFRRYKIKPFLWAICEWAMPSSLIKLCWDNAKPRLASH